MAAETWCDVTAAVPAGERQTGAGSPPSSGASTAVRVALAVPAGKYPGGSRTAFPGSTDTGRTESGRSGKPGKPSTETACLFGCPTNLHRVGMVRSYLGRERS